MPSSLEPSLPSDVHLLLRADAEQCWLRREVLPVLQEVETPEDLHEEEVGAALAYLEAMWSEATLRARETDDARTHLSDDTLTHLSDDALTHPSRNREHEVLASLASRYHTAVQVLRRIVAERVTPFVDPTFELAHEQPAGEVRVKDTRSDGCAPRAA